MATRSSSRASPPLRAFLLAAALVVAGLAIAALWPWRRGGSGREAEPVAEADAGEAELPFVPDREEVRRVLRSFAPYVAQCEKGKAGVIRVHLEVSGKTGQVRSATVAKGFDGTVEADCVTGVLGAAQFPRFRKKTLSVVFPYTFGEVPDGGSPAPAPRAPTASPPGAR